MQAKSVLNESTVLNKSVVLKSLVLYGWNVVGQETLSKYKHIQCRHIAPHPTKAH